jgi:methylated-DNA-[protein]-cysteine S-methyltransferase
MSGMNKYYYAFENIAGINFEVFVTQKGLKKLLFNSNEKVDDGSSMTKLRSDDPYLFNIFNQLDEYFKHKRKKFDIPLDFDGTPFQMKVWNELLKIPYGKTTSYGKLSQKLGDPKLIRAVGRANGANPIPIIIPCHRVINSNGNLGGYTGGLKMKEILLELEGALSLELFN